MSNRIAGEVEFVTGTALRQVIRLTQKGTDIIAVDIHQSISEIPPLLYADLTADEIAESVRQASINHSQDSGTCLVTV